MVSQKRKRAEQSTQSIGSKRPSLAPHNGNAEYSNGVPNESFVSAEDSELVHQLQQVSTPHEASNTAAQALAAQIHAQENNMSFVNGAPGSEMNRHLDSSFDLGGDNGTPSQHQNMSSPYDLPPFNLGATSSQGPAARDAPNGSSAKPAVGTDEWHKVRRDNHKEGEFAVEVDFSHSSSRTSANLSRSCKLTRFSGTTSA